MGERAVRGRRRRAAARPRARVAVRPRARAAYDRRRPADREGTRSTCPSTAGPSASCSATASPRSSAARAASIWRWGFNLGGLSADERLVCIAHAEQGDEVRKALRVFDVATGQTVGDQWDGEGLGLNADAWSPVPGDQRLAISHERLDRTRPAIWDLATGERTDLEVDLPGDVVPMDWWPDASALLVVHVFEGRDELYRLEVATGALERIQHEAGTVHEARVRPDGDVWMQLSSGGRPPHAVSARSGTEVVRRRTAHRPACRSSRGTSRTVTAGRSTGSWRSPSGPDRSP